MPVNRQRTIVIALGGNSLIRANEKGTIEEQYANLRRTSEQLLELLTGENRIVITHDNGPQVGNLPLACEAARDIVPYHLQGRMPQYLLKSKYITTINQESRSKRMSAQVCMKPANSRSLRQPGKH